MKQEIKTKETEIGILPQHWTVTHFNDLFAVPLRNGLTRPTSVRGNGIKMVNMGEIFAIDRIRHVEMERVLLSEKEMTDFLLAEGDLLFARQSLVLSGVGKVSIFLGDSEPVTFEGHLIRVRLWKGKCDPAFYYYFFKSPGGRALIEGYSEQVAAAGIRGSDLAKIPVPYPQLEEQQDIARIFSKIDDKIELNRQMNTTIENIGQALFKHWFVDFEFPNEKGRPYKSSGGEMVDSELGEIPKGWTAGILQTVTSLIRDGTHNPPKRIENGIPLITGVNIGQGFVTYNKMTYISQDDYARIHKNYAPKEGDVLITKIGTLGKVGIIRETDVPIAIHCNVALIRHNNLVSSQYLYWLFRSNLFQNQFHTNKQQTVQEFMNLEQISKLHCVIPSTSILERFNKIIIPIFNKMSLINQQNIQLSDIRDSLLPKLMSGHIRVNIP